MNYCISCDSGQRDHYNCATLDGYDCSKYCKSCVNRFIASDEQNLADEALRDHRERAALDPVLAQR
jgi:hypothetical protein